jgi:hypothetical protein
LDTEIYVPKRGVTLPREILKCPRLLSGVELNVTKAGNLKPLTNVSMAQNLIFFYRRTRGH